jgi:hypothetical protein
MKLVSQREDWDRVSALLSADWFLPHWHIIGLRADTKTRERIGEGAKTIVMKFMGSAAAYLNVDFSDARLQATRDELFRLVKNESGISIVDALASADSDDNTTMWLLDALTLQAIDESASATAATEELSSDARAAIRAAYSQTEAVDLSNHLERASLQSASAWDRQLRSWSPGQPTWLTDWLFARSFDGTSFKRFWIALKGVLTEAEAARVRNWYAAQAKALADKDTNIALPRWMT